MLLKVAECEHPETNRTAVVVDSDGSVVIVCLTCGAWSAGTPVNVVHRGRDASSTAARDGPSSPAVRDALRVAVVL